MEGGTIAETKEVYAFKKTETSIVQVQTRLYDLYTHIPYDMPKCWQAMPTMSLFHRGICNRAQR
jgi:hypothetical protein